MQGVRNGAGSEVMQRSGKVFFCTLKCNLPLRFSCTGTGVIKRPESFSSFPLHPNAFAVK